MHRLAAAIFNRSIRSLLWHFGGLGLIPLGLADNSLIPLPGSMDAVTIVLSASHQDLWWYYAIMATIGAVAGGYPTYRLGARGGKEALAKRISPKRAQQLYSMFKGYGFWSVFIGAVCPPPMPIVPFLLTAGALQYPRRKFLTALALGRAVRYTSVAYLGSMYGRRAFQWLGRYYEPALYGLIAVAVVGGLVGLYLWKRHQDKARPAPRLPKAA
jgi:membrane protein YqaA with SNARE-associated domain